MARDLNVKIFVHGYFGFGNIGDEAILSVLIEEFKNIFSKAEFTVLSSNPWRTMRIHCVKAIRERLISLDFWKHFSQISYTNFCWWW